MTVHRPHESRQNQTVPQSNRPRPQNKDKIDSRNGVESNPTSPSETDDQEAQAQETEPEDQPALVDQKGPRNRNQDSE